LWDIVEQGSEPGSEEFSEEEVEEQELMENGAWPGVPAEEAEEPSQEAEEEPEPEPEAENGLDPSEFDIPVVLNADVLRWVHYFQGRGSKYYRKWLGRQTRYQPMISAALTEAGLPQDTLYLAMIESGFSPHAKSTASAVGLWQFIAPTGRGYGLRIDYWVDERRDPEAATAAAMEMLDDLYRLFGDWPLAWSAYNAGTGRVRGAVRKQGTDDYWELVRLKALPPETRNYVPKIMAAAIIGKHPERYGFTEITPRAPLAYETVEVAGSVTLDVIARCAGVDEAALVTLNPALLRGATPPDSTTRVHIPPGTTAAFQAAIAQVPAAERVTYRKHLVESGDSLGSISALYGVGVDALVEFNRISNPNRISVGMEVVVPLAGMEAGSKKARASGEPMKVKVRTGDSLGIIAQRHGVSVGDLVAWNHMEDPNELQVGQVLLVFPQPLEVGAQ
jgi:membrane-bound lytic murein transglycosylase D